MRRSGARRNAQSRAGVIGEHAEPVEGRAGDRGSGVVRGGRGDGERDRGGRCVTGAVGRGVGERVGTRVVGGRGVDVGAICMHDDGAVRSRGVRRDAQPSAGIVGKNRRADQHSVGRRGAGVVHGHRTNSDGNRRRGGEATGVGSGIGKRVRSRVVGRRHVDVGAVGVDNDGAVRWRGVAGDSEARTNVVAEQARAVERDVGSSGRSVIDSDRVDGDGDDRRARRARGVGHGVGEGIGSRVAGEGRVGVGAVGEHSDRAV